MTKHRSSIQQCAWWSMPQNRKSELGIAAVLTVLDIICSRNKMVRMK